MPSENGPIAARAWTRKLHESGTCAPVTITVDSKVVATGVCVKGDGTIETSFEPVGPAAHVSPTARRARRAGRRTARLNVVTATVQPAGPAAER